MSKRLEILKQSLVKKNETLNARLNRHFVDVRSTNGQPLNDKRNGPATMSRWDRQSDGIRNQIKEVEKTEQAIEREHGKIVDTDAAYKKMPEYVTALIDAGILKQWRKHPRILFVEGVENARICFDEKTGICSHKYASKIPSQEQFAIFRDVYNGINLKQKEGAK